MDDTESVNNTADSGDTGESDFKFESLYNRVLNMGVSEKIKLASLGNKEARSLLIKDSNKTVVQAVMNSPKLTEQEIVGFAADKNLSREVTRIISNNREYLKNYQVKVSLINNPKTPVATALKLLVHLRDGDLRNLARSKSVPSVIATTARKTLNKRGRA